MSRTLQQVRIIHVSDIHFGRSHRFQPATTPDGSLPPDRGFPTLADSLLTDLQSDSNADLFFGLHEHDKAKCESVPLILAVTGDQTDTASADEFAQCRAFIDRLSSKGSIAKDRVFIVPGNHDTLYTENDAGRRWYPYCEFYGDLRGERFEPREAFRLTRVIDRSDPDRIIVAEVNTAFDVRKGTPEEGRGHVDEGTIEDLRDALSRIPKRNVEESIKIALMHHHPVVLPTLAEPNRGYDAIVSANLLLGVFRDFGFHLILHGHKHFPHTFSYDAVCAWSSETRHPLVVVAGGSAGSRELSSVEGATNTYNLITYKWNPVAQEGRVRVDTRGLVRFDARKIEQTAKRWFWRTLRADDRQIAVDGVLSPGRYLARPYDGEKDNALNLSRRQPYLDLRDNMLVAEIVPSLDPTQDYDVILRITVHRPERHKPSDVPSKVEWTGGPKFPAVLICDPSTNPSFSVRFSYYGPMLVAAKLHFQDGSSAVGTVYVHKPGYGSREAG